ncbi:MAG: hypothetical protein H0X45_07475 [Planctomycetes bacterium]|nr:hypothetical protein [Planctomycetota bacterium]
MQKIQSLEHAQRILAQREVHDAQVQQLLDYLLTQHVQMRSRTQGVEALLLASLEFTRMTMTHLEKTGHQEDPEVAESVQRVVVALQKAQALIAPLKDEGAAGDPA